MGSFENGGTPKWIAYNGTLKKKHMFDLGVTPILGNLHVGWSEDGYTTQN
jgi:hypothetical protein